MMGGRMKIFLAGTIFLMVRFLLVFKFPSLAMGLSLALSRSTTTSTTMTKQKLGFLSFDLDDTLFPTSQVVSDANNVMIARLRQKGYPTTVQDFLETTRQVRKSLTAPITYSDLRKRAIWQEMKRVGSDAQMRQVTMQDGDNVFLVEEVFQAWLQERHKAAERYLFSDVVPVLKQIRQTHPDVCIAAITNGRGNPLHMAETLQGYFDFCISGEDEAVFPERKPHAGIYLAALAKYRQTARPEEAPAVVDVIGWCHVGDCLAHDVYASASVGARAIWYNPKQPNNDDNNSKKESAASRLVPSQLSKTPCWSTATPENLSERAKLAQQGLDMVTAQITSLSQLPSVIDQILVSTATCTI